MSKSDSNIEPENQKSIYNLKKSRFKKLENKTLSLQNSPENKIFNSLNEETESSGKNFIHNFYELRSKIFQPNNTQTNLNLESDIEYTISSSQETTISGPCQLTKN